MRKQFWRQVHHAAQAAGHIERLLYDTANIAATPAEILLKAGIRVGSLSQRLADHAVKRRFELLRREYGRDRVPYREP